MPNAGRRIALRQTLTAVSVLAAWPLPINTQHRTYTGAPMKADKEIAQSSRIVDFIFLYVKQ